MASEHPRDPDPQVPLQDGDFHRIPGIGPGIEQRLHAAGIRTFGHLASLNPDEISTMLNGMVGMTPERISHQDWPGKARLLAEKLEEQHSPLEPEELGERQHYASFMVELLQDEEHAVRRTRVVHVQAGSKDSWAGWDSQRLLEWFQQQAGITTQESSVRSEPLARIEPAVRSEPGTPEVSTPGEGLTPERQDALARETLLPKTRAASASHPGRQHRMGTAGVLSTSVIDPLSGQPGQFFHIGSPTTLRLALDMRKTTLAPRTPLAYHVMVEARAVGTGELIRLAEARGEHPLQDEILFAIPLQQISEGTYRLSVSAQLSPAESSQSERDRLQVFTEGGIIHVFSEETVLAG